MKVPRTLITIDGSNEDELKEMLLNHLFSGKYIGRVTVLTSTNEERTHFSGDGK